MPLPPGDARLETGIKEIITDDVTGHGYAKRRDGAYVAIVEGTPMNTSRFDRDDWHDLAASLRDHFDAEIAKNGLPIQMQVSRTPADGIDVETLTDVVRDDDAPTDARTYAALTAEHADDWCFGSGVMDSHIRLVVWASPDEGQGDPRGLLRQRLDALRGKTSTDHHQRVLRQRVQTAEGVLQTLADDVSALDADGVATRLRESWRPHDEPLANPTDTQTHDQSLLWAPHGIDEQRSHVVLSPDDPQARDVATSIRVSGWPVNPGPGILSDILATPGVRLDMAIHIGDRDWREKIDELDTEIAQIRRRVTDLFSGRGARGDTHESQARDGETLEGDKVDLRDHAQDTETEIAEVSTTFTIRAKTVDDALDARGKIISRLRRVGATATPADGDQLVALRTTTPIGHDNLREVLSSAVGEFLSSMIKNGHVELGVPTHFDMPSDSVGCLAPAAHGVRSDDDGVLYGLAAGTHPTVREESPAGFLQICREDLPAPHRYIMGRSGAGKTYMASGQATEELLRERGADRLLILDIAENFEGVINTLGGEKVAFGETSINPWAVDREQGIDLVTDLIDTHLDHNTGRDRPSRSAVRATVRATYDRAESWDRSPVFTDYFDLLADVSEDPDKAGVTLRQTHGEGQRWSETATDLLTHMAPFRPDGEYDFMSPDVEAGDDPEGMVDLSEEHILFDGSEFQEKEGAAKGMLSVLFLSLAYRASDDPDEMVLCVVDEAHDVFRDTEADRFESMVRAGRNRGLCFDFLSQADEDFSADETARIIAKQSSVVISGDVGAEASPDEIEQHFGFPRREAGLICGGLEMGRSETDYSEMVVNVKDRGCYLVRYKAHPIAGKMLTYREHGDGDWDAYTADAYAALDLGEPESEPESDATHDVDPRAHNPSQEVIADD